VVEQYFDWWGRAATLQNYVHYFSVFSVYSVAIPIYDLLLIIYLRNLRSSAVEFVVSRWFLEEIGTDPG